MSLHRIPTHPIHTPGAHQAISAMQFAFWYPSSSWPSCVSSMALSGQEDNAAGLPASVSLQHWLLFKRAAAKRWHAAPFLTHRHTPPGFLKSHTLHMLAVSSPGTLFWKLGGGLGSIAAELVHQSIPLGWGGAAVCVSNCGTSLNVSLGSCYALKHVLLSGCKAVSFFNSINQK